MTLTSNNATDMTTEAFTQWRLSLALSKDVVYVARLTELHNLMYRKMMSTVEAGTAMCIILFVFSLASFVAALFFFYVVGIGPLSRQAQTITSLLYLIPPTVLKESPELQKFVESGALVLDVRSQ
ncbi:hypothetical protein BCR44DRAFT_1432857 [Catenaria anguillulae PL171]|uniref:Uncharacterized protein n=1 Tax=Catenaria anguillulae PL171 TaxID=765915 RepID=A0A1Y2HSM7_9FUNG|nr:hypothetical protein BCR44DRAFT_1432857 [Catenaria anguillulae PL171]